MAERVHMPGGRCPCAIIATFSLLPWALAMAAQASAQPNSQQMEQQRRAQAEARTALEESERRIAASQAEQTKEAQERSEQQRRALAAADRRRETDQHYEEFLVQTRARAQQSNPPQPQDEGNPPQISPPETADAAPPTSALEPQPGRYLSLRQAALVLMIGCSFAALYVLSRIVREWLAR
jgi:hypothetical protein